MPFAPLLQPSLALSLVAASVRSVDVAVLYETLQFAAVIGQKLYALTWLIDHRLSITDGRRYLSLAIPLGEYHLPPGALVRLGSQLVTSTHEALASPEPFGASTPA
jgi:hypothetical protein